MAQYPFPSQPSSKPTPGPHEAGRETSIAQMLVRGLGFVLLIVGLWVALAVIMEAWSLYRNPAGIEHLAQAIEAGSHIDQSLARASPEKSEPDEAANTSAIKPASGDSVLGFRLSYFVAWVIAILLLMLIGRLAILAVKTGGELVLYDRHVLQLAREIVRESTRSR